MRLLILEDSRAQARLLVNGLEANGCSVTHVETIAEVKDIYVADDYDALILDRWVPDGDGMSIVQWLRQAGDETPAIILTSLGELAKRLEGLRAGADDYYGQAVSPRRAASSAQAHHQARHDGYGHQRRTRAHRSARTPRVGP